MALQHLRSSTANKRPTPGAMSDGQLALNTNLASPGLFFKDSNGDSVKIGPVHVGTTAPNVTPGAGGQAGNSKGEQWLDTSSSRYVFKIWDGTAWRSEDGEFVNASGDTMTGALVMDNQQQVRFRETTANGVNFIAIQAPASVAADRTLTLPDVTGTIVSTGDTGTVTSTMILDGTILNADINASAAIVDTKLATIATAGKVSNSATTAASANTASAIVARDASGNFSAGTITAALTGNASTVTTNANLTGDVTSVGNATSIAAGVIVNADVNASAAIAGTKISPDFGSQTIASTGVFSHALGAAATPSITFTGDLDTGVFSPGANQLAVATNGVQRISIDANGLASVGAPTGDARIEIGAGATGNRNAHLDFITDTTYADFGLRILRGSTGADSDAEIRQRGTGSLSIVSQEAGPLRFFTTNTERLRITSAGNVGIGTSSPGQALDVKGSVRSSIGTGTGAGGAGYALYQFGASATVTENWHIGAEGDGSFRFYNQGIGAGIERLRITSAGNVGIGTTSPGSALEINAAAATSPFIAKINTTEAARIDSSGRLLVGTSTARSVFNNTTTTAALQIEGSTANAANLSITRAEASPGTALLTFAKSRGSVGGTPTVVISEDVIGFISFEGADGTEFVRAASIAAEVDGTPGANDMPGRLVFSTTADGGSSPTERMRIDSRGNVFFNNSTPTSTIWSSDNAVFQTGYVGSNGSFGMDIVGNGYRNTAGGWTSLNQDGNIGRSIISLRPGATGGLIIFGADNLTTGTQPTEAMRINSSQELLVGYTADNGAYKLQVNSQIFATSATVATSDGRYKENVSTLGDCVDLVKALRPVSFTWKPQEDITRTDEDGNEVLVREGHNFPNGTQVGFIAQEVQEVLSEKPWLTSVIKQNVRPAVNDSNGNELAPEEEFFGIAEGNLIAVLTSALQEAIAKIEALEQRLTAAGI